MKEDKIMINGPSGKLEARVFRGSQSNVGIICHPHPLYQGSMNNKVVTTIGRTWQTLGLSTVRFNFRGVGESEGVYDHGVGELEDLRSVFEWVKLSVPDAKQWLAGFSFGSFIAAKMASERPTLSGLLTVAPALRIFDFSTLKRPMCPWFIVQGDNDELVPRESLEKWYRSLSALEVSASLELAIVPGASHFFHGQLKALSDRIKGFMERNLK